MGRGRQSPTRRLGSAVQRRNLNKPSIQIDFDFNISSPPPPPPPPTPSPPSHRRSSLSFLVIMIRRLHRRRHDPPLSFLIFLFIQVVITVNFELF